MSSSLFKSVSQVQADTTVEVIPTRPRLLSFNFLRRLLTFFYVTGNPLPELRLETDTALLGAGGEQFVLGQMSFYLSLASSSVPSGLISGEQISIPLNRNFSHCA